MLPWPFTWQLSSVCHLLGFFGPLAIVLQLTGDLLMVTLGLIILFSGFSSLSISLIWLFLAFFWLFLGLCCILSVVGNISIPIHAPALCIAVSSHLREISGTACLLSVSCFYQCFISPHQCRVVTILLNCHRKAEPSRGIHRRDEVCNRKIIDQYEKLKHILHGI